MLLRMDNIYIYDDAAPPPLQHTRETVKFCTCKFDKIKVLVKCRQNVANKLFITRVFNPVRPHTWLTALSLSALLLNALICPKEVETSFFSL